MQSKIIKGRDLTVDELKLINDLRKKEFGSKKDIVSEPNNLFFMLTDSSSKLLCIGKLEELPVQFQEKTFNVLCVSTVIASQKGKGYGTRLMQEIKEYASHKGKTLVGFCETSLLPFYKKCDFGVLSDADNKFVYIDEQGEAIPDIIPGEVFYVDGLDCLIAKVLASDDKTVKVKRS